MKLRVQGSLLFVTYTLIQGIISSEMYVYALTFISVICDRTICHFRKKKSVLLSKHKCSFGTSSAAMRDFTHYVIILERSHVVTFFVYIETAVWTFNPLAPNEFFYMRKNSEMFSLKTLISFRLKKERHKHLG